MDYPDEQTPNAEDVKLEDSIAGATRIPIRREERSDLSQSYHEIFDGPSSYLTSPVTISGGKSSDPQSESSDTDHREGLFPRKPSAETLANDIAQDTKQPEGDVFYTDGELVCEEDTETTVNCLTSKLVADSLMWRQTFRSTSPSPETEERKFDPKAISRKQHPAVDPQLIEDIERHSRRLATEVDNVVENLSGILQSISALTVETVETFRDGVCKTCDAVDDNIKGMYQLMAKWEELNKAMTPAYKTADQIKEVKKLLDVLESLSGVS